MKHRILICGQRTFGKDDDTRPYDKARKFMWLTTHEIVARLGGRVEYGISGGQRTKRHPPRESPEDYGADWYGEQLFDHDGIPKLIFPADWAKWGPRAGPIRNQQMLDEGKPTLVLAFYNDPAQSKGTRDMVARARKAGIPVQEYVV